jgi:hypothetical protein
MARSQAEFCKSGHAASEFRKYTASGSSCTVCETARLKEEEYKKRKVRMQAAATILRRQRGVPERRVGPDIDKVRENRRRSAKAWRERYPEKAAAYARERQVRMPVWADREQIKAIYKAARKTQRETGIRMAVDHEIPLKGELVSGLHVHMNLRVIPYIENAQKRNRYHVT